ncbi:MAG: hypothetical protein LBE56_15200 [Tannerella sp.]|jgi:uncharacterized membrane protein|nr:hypothetical protein [Tannerella sp.]
MARKILFSEVIQASWKGLISQIWLLTGLFIGYITVNLALILFIPFPSKDTAIGFTGIAISLLSLVFTLLFSLGYTKNLFQTLDGEEPQFSAYGRQSKKIITWSIASIIYAVIVLIGLSLLIVPGVYLAIRLQFFAAAIVDEDAGIIASLKRSWEITKGQTLSLFVLLLIYKGLIILGLALIGIGIFVTFPLAGLMYCNAYRKLTAFTTFTDEAIKEER